MTAVSFDDAYALGITAEVPAGPATAGAAPAVPRLAMTSEGLALGGCLLTPEGPIEDGYLVLDPAGSIAAIQRRRPELLPVIETGGVVLPGLIDLHGHPEFNVFAAWEPPVRFANRYMWRDSEIYHRVVREPQSRLRGALPPGTQTRYAEVRALVGATTAIQGASAAYPDAQEALVRNVDLTVFGKHRARAMVDLPSEERPDNLPRLRSILSDIGAAKVHAFYLHLAEGGHDDPFSVREFERAVDLGALTPATVVIHGTALNRNHFGAMREAGSKIVWSPQSQLRLYGEATRVADALDVGLPVGLGADWLPTGSPSLLAELKVARRTLARQGRPATARELVDMVTSTAAAIAGLDRHLGALAPGRSGDVVVLERHHDDPWENVIEAEPADVELVLLGGDLAYGRPDWVAGVAGTDGPGRREAVLAWGKPMLLDLSSTGRTLADLRADLIAEYPQVGPIFA